MTPQEEAEVLVVTSGGRLSIEDALLFVETERDLQRTAQGAGVCTCCDVPPEQPSLLRRLVAWLLSPTP